MCHIVGRGLDPAVQAEVALTPLGRLAEKDLLALPQHFPTVRIDRYVIMPDHIHFILRQASAAAGSRPRPTVPQIVGLYKSGVSRRCGRAVWQASFYDHIIRGPQDYQEICQYIDNNPLKWILDGKA